MTALPTWGKIDIMDNIVITDNMGNRVNMGPDKIKF